MQKLIVVGVSLALTIACGGSSDTGGGQSNQNGGGASGVGGNVAGGGASQGGSSGTSGGGASQGGSSGMSGGGTAGRMGTQCSDTSGCPQPGCQSCPAYVCVNGYCVPEGNLATGGATGAGGASGALKWFSTCGPPVCQVGGGGSTSGIPACTTEQKEGANCTVADQECDTGASCSGPLKCTTSDPTNGGNCPRSRARFKTDIEYVSSEERAKLAEDVQSIPLVRYRYKDGPERQHLGFIIEDVEPSPSVDSANDRVDLYGYTSMAIAALQEQRREIEALKAEVRELRGELGKQKRTGK